jgi:pimeloyl-ACP methyl ester carboxylesterase
VYTCVLFKILQVVRAPAVVVGNSTGALAALQAAVNAPHLLRGLVLLNIKPANTSANCLQE